ncbi:hypothetical protein PVAR5_0389 [Paecilomyces variotii No. 5]|uniref:Uncharacterized protein n=1 Tax=Byssochlamys spectabilis (strain No. 5 / NBRC 109023) TaxID=1356009 RepID=V5HR62_BYSSN|nr:hypothetical protein PVAR5_0389 [Paecilomyces variotii No. 5]
MKTQIVEIIADTAIARWLKVTGRSRRPGRSRWASFGAAALLLVWANHEAPWAGGPSLLHHSPDPPGPALPLPALFFRPLLTSTLSFSSRSSSHHSTLNPETASLPLHNPPNSRSPPAEILRRGDRQARFSVFDSAIIVSRTSFRGAKETGAGRVFWYVFWIHGWVRHNIHLPLYTARVYTPQGLDAAPPVLFGPEEGWAFKQTASSTSGITAAIHVCYAPSPSFLLSNLVSARVLTWMLTMSALEPNSSARILLDDL